MYAAIALAFSPTDDDPAAGFAGLAVRWKASRYRESGSQLTVPKSGARPDAHVSVSGARPPESLRDDRRDTGLPAHPAAPRTTASNRWLRSRPRSALPRPNKILVQHFLRGELPFQSIRRFRCPTWRCFVALRVDRRLQFSSRPPSPEPFWLDSESLLGSSRGRRTYVISHRASLRAGCPMPQVDQGTSHSSD